jgi:hypothetical protein
VDNLNRAISKRQSHKRLGFPSNRQQILGRDVWLFHNVHSDTATALAETP